MASRTDQVSDLIAFVRVRDMERSIAFYQLLGFDVRDTYHVDDRLDWAALQREHARLMLALSTAPIDPHRQAVLFYLYARDLVALRERLLAAGVSACEIHDGTPGPEREMRVADPTATA